MKSYRAPILFLSVVICLLVLTVAACLSSLREEVSVKESTLDQLGVTHGRPQLGGPFSDFVGRYGTPISDPPTRALWVIGKERSTLIVTCDDRQKVVLISYVSAAPWKPDQYQRYLESFYPEDAHESTSMVAGQIEYTSRTVPHFFVHLSQTNGWMNSVYPT